VHYVGIEPDEESAREAQKRTRHLNAEIHHRPAEELELGRQFDFVTSFSVFEHVSKRPAYLETVKRHLAPGGVVFMNYDSGHFVKLDKGCATIEKAPANLTTADVTDYYEKFVEESEFRRMAAAAGLAIQESRSFNTWLKRNMQFIEEQHRSEFNRRWLELELWMNDHSVGYTDDQAAYFLSRNHLMVHAQP
jgi:2-polyprenyl-3-methyl-5-hydroxy-6-metoxy-1,4-benzoquinol methylase